MLAASTWLTTANQHEPVTGLPQSVSAIVAESVERAADYVLKLTSQEWLRKAGIVSSNLWLKGLRAPC
jgi:hypothetical protein